MMDAWLIKILVSVFIGAPLVTRALIPIYLDPPSRANQSKDDEA